MSNIIEFPSMDKLSPLDDHLRLAEKQLEGYHHDIHMHVKEDLTKLFEKISCIDSSINIELDKRINPVDIEPLVNAATKLLKTQKNVISDLATELSITKIALYEHKYKHSNLYGPTVS